MPLTIDDQQSRWQRLHERLHRNRAMSVTTKAMVTLVGSVVLAAGLIMMVTPGPGLVGIVAGLAILATEWDWAERWLTGARRRLQAAKTNVEAMEPRERRRRIVMTSGAAAVVSAAVVGYLVVSDWPHWSVRAWDRAQSYVGLLPELPGM